MKFTKLQRIGIILSISWAIGAGIYTHNSDIDRAEDFAKFAYKVCADGKVLHHDPDLSSCDQERESNLKIWMHGSDSNVAIAALAPIPMGWLAAFILLYIGRAQIIGFRAVVPWATLSWWKKIFVVFSTVVTILVVGFAAIAVLNLYVDTLVPVALDPLGPTVDEIGDNVITAKGTWVRSGSLEEGSAVADPLQTSLIKCTKEDRRCIEARAYITGNVLQVDLGEHDIESWTANAIVLRDDNFCASEVYSIDPNTHSVTGAGYPINTDNSYCKMYPLKETKWSYTLSNGFKVYWQQRQKARPLPLRLIQTLFGN
jgi:hypothetical protein